MSVARLLLVALLLASVLTTGAIIQPAFAIGGAMDPNGVP